MPETTRCFNQPDLSLGDSKALGGNGNFGRITSSVAGTERHMQFSLRLNFLSWSNKVSSEGGPLRRAAFFIAPG